MNQPENFNHLKMEAYAGLQKHDGAKTWIRMLEATPYILGPTRGNLLLGVNTGMRLLDDFADGDRPIPGNIPAVAYLEAKQAFIRNPVNPQDDIDRLFAYCYQLADRAGVRIDRELNAFFNYFLFDARRRGTGQVFSRVELDEAYDACDIAGTIRGSLMVFGDDPEKAHHLMPLGKAVRTFYTLRDYEDDIAAGFVNIPREATEAHGITEVDLPDRFSPPVRAWFHEEATLGLQRLDDHNKIMGREKFRLIGKLVLPMAYIKPAQSYLQAVLAGKR